MTRLPDRLLRDRLRIIRQLDLYGRLLTEHQRRLMAMNCLDDLSLSEIAETVGTTRQAVYDGLRRAIAELDRFEEAMGLAAAAAARQTHVTAALDALAAVDAALPARQRCVAPVRRSLEAVRRRLEALRA